jgi:hypothetical protein
VEMRWARETSEWEHRACFEELTLLQTQGSELCHAIVGAPQARHLSEGMRHAALRYTEVAEELATFWAIVSFATELVLGCSPGNTVCVEVVNELVIVFQKAEMHHSKLEQPVARIYDLLLRPSSSRA